MQTYVRYSSLLLFAITTTMPQSQAMFSSSDSSKETLSILSVDTQTIPVEFANKKIVRQSKELANNEQLAQVNRLKINHYAQEMFLKTSLEQPVPVSLILSGGGVRATLSSLGMVLALQELELVDAITYIASLSGSTWFVAPWLAHGKSLTWLTEHLHKKLVNTYDSNKLLPENVLKSIIKPVVKKISECGYLSTNDLYGSLLADLFLRTNDEESAIKGDGQNIHLSQFKADVINGNFPIPVFTSAIGQTNPNYQWFEFTPFEAGSPSIGWVPMHVFGKKIKGGSVKRNLSEETLGYLMGAWGSAYTFDVKDLLVQTAEQIQWNFGIKIFTNLLMQFLPENNGLRMSPSTVFNIGYKLDNCPLKNKEHLHLIDAGIDVNLPFYPMLRRTIAATKKAIPFYIVCDASGVGGIWKRGSQLFEVEQKAKERGFPFPTIDHDKIENNLATLWYDKKDPNVPVVLYIQNPVQADTLKFQYSTEEFKKMVGETKKLVLESADLIKKGFNIAVENYEKQIVKSISLEALQKEDICVPQLDQTITTSL